MTDQPPEVEPASPYNQTCPNCGTASDFPGPCPICGASWEILPQPLEGERTYDQGYRDGESSEFATRIAMIEEDAGLPDGSTLSDLIAAYKAAEARIDELEGVLTRMLERAAGQGAELFGDDLDEAMKVLGWTSLGPGWKKRDDLS